MGMARAWRGGSGAETRSAAVTRRCEQLHSARHYTIRRHRYGSSAEMVGRGRLAIGSDVDAEVVGAARVRVLGEGVVA